MNSAVIWIVVALGLAVPIVRRRSVAVAAVTVQSLVLAAYAAERANGADDILAAAALLARAGLLGSFLFVVVRRTRELRPVRAHVGPLRARRERDRTRVVAPPLVPSLGLGDRNVERAVLALIAFGLVTVATRRATVLQIVALVQVDNALAVAALGAAGGLPALIELLLGVAADLIGVVLVAALLHARIYAEFGTGDTAQLRQLRAACPPRTSLARSRSCPCSRRSWSRRCQASALASASRLAAASSPWQWLSSRAHGL